MNRSCMGGDRGTGGSGPDFIGPAPIVNALFHQHKITGGGPCRIMM